MHWAPIPITEFTLPPPSSDFAVADKDIYRLLSRAPRRGFWLFAIAFIVLLAIGVDFRFCGKTLDSVLFFVIALLPGTGHFHVRHRLNVALWTCREPAAVFWAEPRQHGRRKYLLTLHTPAPVTLEAILTPEELITVLHWLRQRNPDALIGSYSPNDSFGRLSGYDLWSTEKKKQPNHERVSRARAR